MAACYGNILCAQQLLCQSRAGVMPNKAYVVQALPDTGCLVACERDEHCMQLARKFWAAAGVSHMVSFRLSVFAMQQVSVPLHTPPLRKFLISGMWSGGLIRHQPRAEISCPHLQIDQRMGPASDTLQALLDEGRADSFDFAFIGILFLCSSSVSSC